MRQRAREVREVFEDYLRIHREECGLVSVEDYIRKLARIPDRRRP